MATGKARTSQETYILLQDDATITNSTSVGKKASKFSLRPKKKEKNEARSTQYVPAGTLLRKDLQTGGQEVYVPLSGSKLEDCHRSYASSVVAKLSNEEYDLLALISSHTKRIEVYKDKAWMGEGLNLEPKERVEIHGYSTIQDGTRGIVTSKRWKDPGIDFDVQLLDSKINIIVTIENIRKYQTASLTGAYHSPHQQGNTISNCDPKYAGVKFVQEVDGACEIVLYSWLHTFQRDNHALCCWPPGPGTKCNQRAIKNCICPGNGWSSFEVQIIFEADDYATACSMRSMASVTSDFAQEAPKSSSLYQTSEHMRTKRSESLRPPRLESDHDVYRLGQKVLEKPRQNNCSSAGSQAQAAKEEMTEDFRQDQGLQNGLKHRLPNDSGQDIQQQQQQHQNSTKSEEIHAHLALRLKGVITSGQLKSLTFYFIKIGGVDANAKVKDFSDLWDELESRGKISPGKYDILEDALTKVEAISSRHIIQETKEMIKSHGGAYKGWNIRGSEIVETFAELEELKEGYRQPMEKGMCKGTVFDNAAFGLIDPDKGGEVRLNNGSVRLQVPMDAVAQKTIFSVYRASTDVRQFALAKSETKDQSYNEGIVKYSLPVRLGPHNIQFQKPVRLTLKDYRIPDHEMNESMMCVYRKEDENSAWTKVPYICYYDSDKLTASIDIDHFSSYVLGMPATEPSVAPLNVHVIIESPAEGQSEVKVYFIMNDYSLIEEFLEQNQINVNRETCLYIDPRSCITVSCERRHMVLKESSVVIRQEEVLHQKNIQDLAECSIWIGFTQLEIGNEEVPLEDMLVLEQNGKVLVELPFKRSSMIPADLSWDDSNKKLVPDITSRTEVNKLPKTVLHELCRFLDPLDMWKIVAGNLLVPPRNIQYWSSDSVNVKGDCWTLLEYWMAQPGCTTGALVNTLVKSKQYIAANNLCMAIWKGANSTGGRGDAFPNELKKKQKSIKPEISGRMGMKSRSWSVENILDGDSLNLPCTSNRNLHKAGKKHAVTREIYILLQDDVAFTNSTSAGKKVSKFSLRPKKKDKNKSKSTQYLPAGTLLHKDSQTEVYIPLSASNSEDFCISCAPSAVAKLSTEEYELLAGIHACAKRMKVYNDKAWMGEGLDLQPKDQVQIYGLSAVQDGTHGIVKSKRCEAAHSGIWFDVQLLEPKKTISVTIENIRKCRTNSPTGIHHSPKPGANLAEGGDDAVINELKKKQKSIKPGRSGKMGMKSRSRSVENILDDELPKPSSTLNRILQAAEKKHAAARGQESPTNYPSPPTLAAQTGKPLNRPVVETKRQPLPLPSPKCTGGMGKKSLSKSMDSLLDDLPKSPAQGGLQSFPSVENVLDDECRKPSSTLNRNPHTAEQKHVTVRELESPTNNPLQRSHTLAAQTKNHQEKFPFTHSKPLNKLAETKSRKCTGGMGKKSLSKSMNSLLDDDLPTSPTGGGVPSDLHSSSVENAMDNDHLKPSCTSKRKFHKAAKKHAAVHELESSTNNLSQRSHGLAAQTENHQENITFSNSKPLNHLAIRTERRPLPLPSPEYTGGMGKKSLSKSMDSLLDDRLKTSKSESPMIDRNPPEPKLFSSEKSPLGSSESHTSGRTWRCTSGPVEDDDRNYDPPSPTSKPRTTSDTPSQRYKLEPIDYDDEDDMATSPETHEPHYVNIDRSRAGETVEEETEPVYVNVPHPGQNQRKAAENEPIYANLPHPTQVTNGTHEVPPLEDHQEESSAIDDQVENAGAAASTVNNNDDDTYGLFSCQGFLTDHNAVFSQCEQRLLEEDHPYEAIQVSVNPEDIFDQTYPLDPNQQYTGTCAIIDQFTYDRKGTYIDVRTIYELFENLFKFRIDYQKNLSKKEFLAVFKKHHDYMANPANRVQRFVCFILGHGDEEGIMTCVNGLGSRFNVEEGARIDVNKDLLPFLSSCSLKTMAGKPKLFFIQACRGHAFQGGQGVQGEADPHDGIDQGGDPSPDETILLPHMSVPNDSDILVAYAQTAGNQAFRDMRSGSWFIQAVADIFRDYHERYDVLSMMTMVSNAVSYMSCHNPNGSEHKQSPTVQHTLRKKMFMLRASP